MQNEDSRMNDTDNNETASRPSSESACSTAWMRENADQVKRTVNHMNVLVLKIEDVKRNIRKMEEKLNAVSPGSTDEGGQLDVNADAIVDQLEEARRFAVIAMMIVFSGLCFGAGYGVCWLFQ